MDRWIKAGLIEDRWMNRRWLIADGWIDSRWIDG